MAGGSRYSAAKGRQFRLAFILMISMTAENIQDRFCFKDTPPKRETVESNDQSIDSNVENAASQIHPNELRDCQDKDEREVIKAIKESRRTQITCLLFSPAILLHCPLPPRQKFLHVNQTKSCFAF